TMTAGRLSEDNDNYPNLEKGKLTITPNHLTLTAHDTTRTYGDSNPALDATISGFKNGEGLATSGITGSANCTTSAIATSSVAGSPYAIACTSGTLAASNYDFPAANFI